MEKELFKILQELKIDINSLENNNYNDIIRDLTATQCTIETLDVVFSQAYTKAKNRFILYSILTLGIYYVKHIKDFNDVNNVNIGIFNELETRYNIVKKSKVYYKLEKYLNDLKLSTLKNNYNQINNFIELANNMSNEEKQKYLSYTMN